MSGEFSLRQELHVLETMNRSKKREIEQLRAELEKVKAERNDWKDAAEYQYMQYRVARFGDDEHNYSIKGALDAWFANKYKEDK